MESHELQRIVAAIERTDREISQRILELAVHSLRRSGRSFSEREEQEIWHEILELAVRSLHRSMRSLSEKTQDVSRIREVLECQATEDQMLVLWEHFSVDQMMVPWMLVDEENLTQFSDWVRGRQVS